MRCNRKTDCLAVTPHKKAVSNFSITEIWQLRRREKAKRKLLILKHPLSKNAVFHSCLSGKRRFY